jgi:hypothetical protein
MWRYLLLLCAGLSIGRGASTNWELEPSFKYDALCLLNILSGDPYYLNDYQSEYDHLHPLFTPEENAAFVRLKQIIKDEGGGIISARLALYFSTVEDETLPQMIRTAHDSTAMREALKRTPYWSEKEWSDYERARPSLEIALRALERTAVPAYWGRTARPKIERQIAGLAPDLPKYDILPVIEKYLGFSLPSKTISVYLLEYSKPHGIRITGLRFLTHESYPFRIVLHNAIHEPMHPPFNASDPKIHEAIDLLGRDPLVADKVKNHDHSFGYNTAPGLIDEDSVEALEQIVAEQFGVGYNARKYWASQDGGLHVLAAAIYTGYKTAVAGESVAYSDWFVKAVQTGELRGEKLKATVDRFFAEPGSANK